jgi:hypothetical protein
MKQPITEGPIVQANVRPDMKQRLAELANQRAVSVAFLVREALDRAYGPEPLPERAPEPFPTGVNLRPPPRSPGFMS